MDVRLEIEQGSRQQRTFRMKGRDMVIGRVKGCGLKIPSGSVSRKHCRLTVAEGILQVEDLDSANGTLVNGYPVQWSVLRPGDLLTVGPITFRVEYPLTPEAVDRILESKPTRPKPPPLAGKKKKRKIEDEQDVPMAIPLDESQAEMPIPDALELRDELAKLEEEPVEEKPRKKKKKKKQKPANEEASNPDYSIMMKDAGNWSAPTGENLRDLLSQLEDEEE